MTTRAVPAAAAARPLAVVGDYVRLTKPRIISLLLVTTAGAMFVAAAGVPDGWLLVWTMIGGYLAAGGANAINHYVDRDIDGRMSRTTERPVVAGRVPPARALAFGVALGALSALVLGLAANWLTAALALLGLVLYVGLYTLWLKRTSVHNIAIGGSAGAVPPLVGWAAVTGEVGLSAWLLFAIVFYWTPPHFWALALLLRRDYAAAGVPMLPVVAGDRETKRQILLWTVVMVAVTLLPVASGAAGAFYLVAALVLGGIFLVLAALLARAPELEWARATFHYSLLYLALVFVALVIDAA
ncbi:heme o synthase [Miltoncostaea marina]|uniref:heme o synthase n=1 Tax=Miltoncostaea marina TaxID=2843215 RepID=UPI001C3C9955|nr:heme o synthase [Miltoncostaea marina]